ncbi:polk-prov related protein [Cyclospora cayetanensis]|uniref:Polk-prov related protein n=1 Tax=Cyclospora cayetanensis TaxID=88456 RepID=A0A1D3D1A1_9EIME|nr:polk-prov related protein [Cyclospora cayetanensis]
MPAAADALIPVCAETFFVRWLQAVNKNLGEGISLFAQVRDIIPIFMGCTKVLGAAASQYVSLMFGAPTGAAPLMAPRQTETAVEPLLADQHLNIHPKQNGATALTEDSSRQGNRGGIHRYSLESPHVESVKRINQQSGGAGRDVDVSPQDEATGMRVDCLVDEREAPLGAPPQGVECSTASSIEIACRQTFIFGNYKAGMDMTEEEKAKIAARIFELSKNSPFFANEMRYGTEYFYTYWFTEMRSLVEMRDNPSLASVPMAVGSMSMLATANYAARRFGVRSAMPGFIAKQLCPSLVIVPPSFSKYRAAGEVVRRVLEKYDPTFSSHSLDEASLDVTDYLSARVQDNAESGAHSPVCISQTEEGTQDSSTAADPVTALVTEIRAAVSAATGLSCSAAMRRVVHQLAVAVAEQLREQGQESDHITLKIKLADFSLRTISHRLLQHTDDSTAIATAAQGLLQSFLRGQQLKQQANGTSSNTGQTRRSGAWVRLLGVRCAGLRQAKARSSGLRRLEEFFLQQRQPLQKYAESAATSDTDAAGEGGWRNEDEELDDLLAVISQYENEGQPSHAAVAPIPAQSETDAAPQRPAVLECQKADGAHVSKAEALGVAAPVAKTLGPIDMAAAREEARQRSSPSSRKPSVEVAGKSNISTSTTPTQQPDSKQLHLSATRQQHHQDNHPRQRRRCPSPPIHQRLKQQKRQKMAQQHHQQLLALFKGPRKQRQQPQVSQRPSPQQHCPKDAPESRPKVIEIVSD